MILSKQLERWNFQESWIHIKETYSQIFSFLPVRKGTFFVKKLVFERSLEVFSGSLAPKSTVSDQVESWKFQETLFIYWRNFPENFSSLARFEVRFQAGCKSTVPFGDFLDGCGRFLAPYPISTRWTIPDVFWTCRLVLVALWKPWDKCHKNSVLYMSA